MVTAAGTFNSVQLAFTHILSHAGAVGPDADPVMGLAGGDPDCVANAFRLLIPNVKAGGLIGRGGCTIKAIREHSGARIEISSNAFHFHPVHGPLPAPSPSLASHSGPNIISYVGNGGRPGAGVIRAGGSGTNAFGPGGGGGPVGPVGGHGGGGPERNGIILPPPILMDRVMTAMGSFDACLRAHHLVASKLMDVRPSPVPMQPGLPPASAAAAAAAAALFASMRGGGSQPGGVGPQGGPQGGAHGLRDRVVNFDSVRGAVREGRLSQGVAGKTPTAATSPASSVSEHSSPCHRQPWDFEDRSWISTSPLSERREIGGRGGGFASTCSSPGLVSSSTRESPPSSAGSPERVGSAADASVLTHLSLAAPPFSATAGGDAVGTVLSEATSAATAAAANVGGGARVLGGGPSINHSNNNNNHNNEELPACLVDIIDSFFGGSSSGLAEPRSPSIITGIDVEVGRAAFALLGVRDLDDIKHLSGAGIIAPESPESYCHLSGEVMAAAAAVLSGNGGAVASAAAAAARGKAPAEGLGLAAAGSEAAAAAVAGSSETSANNVGAPVTSSSSGVATAATATTASSLGGSRRELFPVEGFSLQGEDKDSFSSPSGSASFSSSPAVSPSDATTTIGNIVHSKGEGMTHSVEETAKGNTENMGGGYVSVAVAGGGVSTETMTELLASDGGIKSDGVAATAAVAAATPPNALKTVRITGTAEEVQLAEYLIRVRTAGRDMVAA